MDEKDFAELMEALREVKAYREGKLALPTRLAKPDPHVLMTQRKAIAKSRAKFERLYGVPASSLQEWEQGRRSPDTTTRAYLSVIFRDPVGTAKAYAASQDEPDDAPLAKAAR